MQFIESIIKRSIIILLIGTALALMVEIYDKRPKTARVQPGQTQTDQIQPKRNQVARTQPRPAQPERTPADNRSADRQQPVELTPPPEPDASSSPGNQTTTSSIRPAPAKRHPAAPLKQFRLPARLDAVASEGQRLFSQNCQPCHGQNGQGTTHGPPLIHNLYGRSNRTDMAFLRAARFGVGQNNWTFGDMPAISAVNETDVRKIIAFVRAVQQENGIR